MSRSGWRRLPVIRSGWAWSLMRSAKRIVLIFCWPSQLVVPRIQADYYCVLGCQRSPQIATALRHSGLHWSATLIGLKGIFVLGRSTYHRRYEPIWDGWSARGGSS
jgi:hypothetical protein